MARPGAKGGARGGAGKGGTRTDVALMLARLGPALAAMMAGYPVLFGGPRGWAAAGPAAAALAGVGEARLWGFLAGAVGFAGGLLLAIGLLARPAAWVLAATALAIAWIALQGVGFGAAATPLAAALVCSGLALLGPGRYALDPR